jgi:hypothetical protein
MMNHQDKRPQAGQNGWIVLYPSLTDPGFNTSPLTDDSGLTNLAYAPLEHDHVLPRKWRFHRFDPQYR